MWALNVYTVAGMNKSSIHKKSGTNWKCLREMCDDEIDLSDIPPVNNALLKNYDSDAQAKNSHFN